VRRELTTMVLGAVLAILVVEVGLGVSKPPELAATKQLASPDQVEIVQEASRGPALPRMQYALPFVALAFGLGVYAVSRRRIG